MTEMESPYWAVLQTRAQHEFSVENRMIDAGRETYLPRCKLDTGRIAALFPTYLFVRIRDGWVSLHYSVGVTQVLMSGECPSRLPDNVVAELKSREIHGLVQLPPALKVGDRVLITRGIFAGYTGLYQGQSPRARARVLLGLLGRIELPTDQIQALA